MSQCFFLFAKTNQIIRQQETVAHTLTIRLLTNNVNKYRLLILAYLISQAQPACSIAAQLFLNHAIHSARK